MLGDLVEEAAGQVVLAAPPQAARAGVQQIQAVHRPGHPDVRESALLLDVLLVERALVREDALFHAGDEDDGELEALGVVEGHQREELARVGIGVGVGVEGDLLEKAVERRLGGATVVLAGDAEELLEVLEPALGLERALALEPSS